MADEAEKPRVTLENWSEFSLEDLGEMSDVEAVWNRYVLLKQAEINTMLHLLPQLRKNRIDSLCSAVNGQCDPLPD
jgi:hypothetical protein